MKKRLLIIFFFLVSCGYQPIFLNKDVKNLEYSKVIFDGNSEINKKIINSLPIKENKTSENQNEFYIFSSYKIETTSKNTQGQDNSFRTSMFVDIKIDDKNKNDVKSKKFTKVFTYSNKKNKFELVEYQNAIKNNLIKEIISEITIYLISQ